ncbi:MAG: multifunctional CCA addition/repair protein [Marinagarivorans sp.]
MQIFLVGGAVRDQLLGLPVTEKDWVVVGASADELLAQGFKAVGKDFPVFLHPHTQEEYALARQERKTAPGYAGFSFNTHNTVRLEEDLLRRDLTINAMAQDDKGAIIDPYGGQQDLQARMLRHVSAAFSEDPVRILRIARFSARYHHLGFTIAPETLDLMRAMVAAREVDHLVPERVWKETARALHEPSPAVFFQVLRNCGALERLMPELDALFGVPQRAEYHPEIDTGVHSLMALSQACLLSDSTAVRFAALIHDLGKALTPADLLPRHHGHELAGLAPIKSLAKRLALPNDILELALLSAEFHTHSHRALELTPQSLVKLFTRLDAFRRPARLASFCACCEADARGRTGFEERPYPQAEYLRGALAACQAINVSALIAQGLANAALGTAIHEQRIKILGEYKRLQA